MSDTSASAPLPHETPSETPPGAPLGLGYRLGFYFLLTPQGELRTVAGKDLEAGRGILELFGGVEDRLQAMFPREGGGWNPRAAGRWIMRECAARGLVDLEAMEVRGPGTWRAGSGCAVAHCGDALVCRGADCEPAGSVAGRTVWAAAPSTGRPADMPADREETRAVLEALRAGWGWKREIDADLWFGWVGVALLGGFPSWRPGLLVSGPRGSGKSELMDLAATLLGPMARPQLNGATEAGLRQGGNGQARAMLLDEAEPGPDGLPLQAILGFIRRMTGGSGGRVARGGANHIAHHFFSVGAGYLTAILPPPMTPQDRSRIVPLELGPLPAADPAQAAKALVELRVEAGDCGPSLWRRMLEQSPRWDATVAAFAAEARRSGADHRDADTAAALVAGRDLLIEDGDVTSERVELARPLLAAIIGASFAADTSSEAELCLNHLLGSLPPIGNTRVCSVAELLALVANHGGAARRDEINALGRVGLRVLPERAGLAVVSGAHPQLSRLFAGTRWVDGAHRAALLALDGAEAEAHPLRIGGRKVRAIRLPAEIIPQEGEADE